MLIQPNCYASVITHFNRNTNGEQEQAANEAPSPTSIVIIIQALPQSHPTSSPKTTAMLQPCLARAQYFIAWYPKQGKYKSNIMNSHPSVDIILSTYPN